MQYGRSDKRSPGVNMVLQRATFPNLVYIGSLIVLVTLIGLVRESRSEDYVLPTDEKGPFDCQRLMLMAAKRLMKVLSKCSREIKATTANNKEFAEKIGCVIKCAMRGANLTNTENMITKESLYGLIKRFSPSEFLSQEMLIFLTDHCAKVAASVDPKEEKCLTYANYVTCMQSTFEDFINTSPYCIKKKKKNAGPDE